MSVITLEYAVGVESAVGAVESAFAKTGVAIVQRPSAAGDNSCVILVY